MKPSLFSSFLFNAIFTSLLVALAIPCRAQWTMEDDLPVPVGEIDPGVWEGKIYVFGGKIDGVYSSDTVWVFTPETGWAFGGKMPDSLEDVYVEEFKGKFYLFGGHSHPDFVYRKEVMRYDPATQIFDTVGMMPSKRAFFTTVVLNDKIYLIGGDDDVSGATNTVDIFDPDISQWEIGPPMPTKRLVHSADTLGGKIYVTGGTAGITAFNTVEVYDPATGWTTSPSTMINPRGFHACKTAGGKLFVLGGTLSTSQPVSKYVEYFDPQLGEWVPFASMTFNRRKLGAAVLDNRVLFAIGGGGDAGYFTQVEKYELFPQSGWEFKKPLATARAYCTSSVVDGKIYVIGGAYSKTETSDVVEMYDPITNEWQTKASLPTPILGASAQTINGKIYVVGGQNVYLGTSKNTLYVYDPIFGWQLKAPMPTARGYLSTAVVDGKLYAIGGTTTYPTRVNTVEMYDPVLNSWATVMPMPVARSGLTCEVVDGKIYAIGGVSTISYFDIVEVYDPATNTWAAKEEMPAKRAIFGSGVVDNMIYVYGGIPDDVNTISNLVKYDPQMNNWERVDTMPEFKVAFASSVVDGCIYGIGGALYPFFFPNMPGPKVSKTVIEYCPAAVGVVDVETASSVLLRSFPNPFSGQTTISYQIEQMTNVRLSIYDLYGRLEQDLLNKRQMPGEYTLVFEGNDLPKGIYMCRLQLGGQGEYWMKMVMQ